MTNKTRATRDAIRYVDVPGGFVGDMAGVVRWYAEHGGDGA